MSPDPSHHRDFSRRRLLLSAGAITAGVAITAAIPWRHALGAVDGRTVNPMELRLGQWLNFGKSDRGIFLRGFSVGWYRGLDRDSEAIRKQNPGPLLDSIDLQITKLANQPKNAQAPLVTVLSRVTILGWLPPLVLLGGEWTRFPMRHRILSLQALVAGAYSEAVWRKVGEPSDSTTLSRKLTNARLIVRSPLPLNPNLMLARLNDFFADKEQLETPLSEAVMKVDTSAIRRRPPRWRAGRRRDPRGPRGGQGGQRRSGRRLVTESNCGGGTAAAYSKPR